MGMTGDDSHSERLKNVTFTLLEVWHPVSVYSCNLAIDTRKGAIKSFQQPQCIGMVKAELQGIFNIFFFCSCLGVLPALNWLTASFCSGDWRVKIYSPDPRILPAQDWSLQFVPICGLVRWKVADVITSRDSLWTWRRCTNFVFNSCKKMFYSKAEESLQMQYIGGKLSQDETFWAGAHDHLMKTLAANYLPLFIWVTDPRQVCSKLITSEPEPMIIGLILGWWCIMKDWDGQTSSFLRVFVSVYPFYGYQVCLW